MFFSRKKAYILAVILAIGLVFLLTRTQSQSFQSPGPMNTGHETLSCLECHESARGTTRQQLQSQVLKWLSLKEEAVSFGYETPNSKDCLACHEKADDKHSIYRFNEPKFSKVRKAIHPESCLSCHQEHHGLRVTSEATNCKNCHEKLSLKHDPLDVSHKVLIENKDWESCLACHDFHGSHKWEVPRKKVNMISQQTLKAYFEGGKDPYGKKKISKARETRYED